MGHLKTPDAVAFLRSDPVMSRLDTSVPVVFLGGDHVTNHPETLYRWELWGLDISVVLRYGQTLSTSV